MTDSKRRLTVTDTYEFNFCEDVISPIDTLFAYCEEDISPDKLFTFCDKDSSLIYRLFNEHPVKLLEAEILKNQSDFLDTAKHHMKGFLKLVEDGHPISGDDAKSLLRGVWLNPCFVRSLGVAIVEDRDLIGSVVCYSNQDSVADRMANMEADPYFKSSVMGLNEPTSTSTFLRLFLSILIGHWGDESLLTELDNRMGKYVFGRRLDMIAKTRASIIERAGKENVIDEFSFYIEDASHAKDLEPLRQLMISKYGQREDIDIEAILEEIKPELSNLLSISQNHLGYDGKKTNIEISLTNGRYGLLSMGPSNRAS
ncbi:hypothetical protein PHJA_001255200 [Phtheirospermum japonicum]|uniref:Uncharacterized protein n=1 Tax=Phtheirospermum japonicum TaxID=374723 RepID=A0A830BYY4_9LAMI|nr:hypothetical protein PHJA_001255200 [Phtheirospermum japonicum]